MNIKELRKSKGITQKFIADKLGITRQWFAKLETGNKEISKLQKEKLAEILNLPIEAFKEGGVVDV
ncbi:MAG: helix-turn-helix transcriptional regulator [uncultured Clostridium sp.]